MAVITSDSDLPTAYPIRLIGSYQSCMQLMCRFGPIFPPRSQNPAEIY